MTSKYQTLGKFLGSRLSLNSQGIAHYILPLLLVVGIGIGGVYTLVSSHAAAPQKGYLLIYSERGRFERAQVSFQGANPNTAAHTCGGKKLAIGSSVSSNILEKNLPALKNDVAKPLRVTCDATGGDASYLVHLGKKNDFSSEGKQTVDVDAGYCTIVHQPKPDQNQIQMSSQIRKTPFKDGKCQNEEKEADIPTKITLTVRGLPKLATNKKSIAGYAELAAPNESLARVQCVGNVSYGVDITEPGKPLRTEYISEIPIKYAKNKATNKGYCAAKISTLQQSIGNGNLGIKLVPGATYKFYTYFKGNVYFNEVAPQTSDAAIVKVP